MFTQNMSTLIT